MNLGKLTVAILALAAAACARAPAADPGKPQAYKLQMPFTPAAGGSLQRLALPASALLALTRTYAGDVRVFDAHDKLVPLALAPDTGDSAQHTTSVPVYPIIGPPDALGRAPLSIRVEGDGTGRVVTVNAGGTANDGGAPAAAVLLDTHTLLEPANAIVLDMDIPQGRTVTLTLLTSANLKDWAPLAEQVLFRPADGSPLLGGGKVLLPGIDLHGRYVGVSWGGAPGVALTGAKVITSSQAPPARVAIAATGVTLADAHALAFALRGATRFSAVRLIEAGPDGVIPLKLYGRAAADDPWTLLGTGTLQPGPQGVSIDVVNPEMTSFKLEADGRTAGFSAMPKLELLFDPVELLVALSGTPPYRLAVGQAAAPDSFLALSEIAPQGSPLPLAQLPRISFTASDAGPATIKLQTSAQDSAFEPRKLWLWVALLIGTLMLAFAAFRLLTDAAKAGPSID